MREAKAETQTYYSMTRMKSWRDSKAAYSWMRLAWFSWFITWISFLTTSWEMQIQLELQHFLLWHKGDHGGSLRTGLRWHRSCSVMLSQWLGKLRPVQLATQSMQRAWLSVCGVLFAFGVLNISHGDWTTGPLSNICALTHHPTVKPGDIIIFKHNPACIIQWKSCVIKTFLPLGNIYPLPTFSFWLLALIILAANINPEEFSIHLCTCPKRPLVVESRITRAWGQRSRFLHKYLKFDEAKASWDCTKLCGKILNQFQTVCKMSEINILACKNIIRAIMATFLSHYSRNMRSLLACLELISIECQGLALVYYIIVSLWDSVS